MLSFVEARGPPIRRIRSNARRYKTNTINALFTTSLVMRVPGLDPGTRMTGLSIRGASIR